MITFSKEVFGQPASWKPKIAANDMLYTTTDLSIDPSNMPMVGNGKYLVIVVTSGMQYIVILIKQQSYLIL